MKNKEKGTKNERTYNKMEFQNLVGALQGESSLEKVREHSKNGEREISVALNSTKYKREKHVFSLRFPPLHAPPPSLHHPNHDK